MKSVTIEQIMSFGPCSIYTREHIEELRKEVCGRRKRITIQDIMNAPIPAQDKIWLLLREEFFTELQLHQISIWCWEKIARPVWEKYYPEDKRPHEAIRIKKLWLKGKATDEQLNVARKDAWAVENAAWAAENAVWVVAREAARVAAWDTAWDTAWEAARVAAKEAAKEAAWVDGRVAAKEAAWVATWKKILKHINKLGVESK
jgi:hypothetical protein